MDSLPEGVDSRTQRPVVRELDTVVKRDDAQGGRVQAVIGDGGSLLLLDEDIEGLERRAAHRVHGAGAVDHDGQVDEVEKKEKERRARQELRTAARRDRAVFGRQRVSAKTE